MPHIHDKPGQYDHTCSAFIIKLGKDPRMILHLHKKIDSYIHFGGHIELNENPWQSMIREIKEESGYDIRQLNILQPKNSLRKIGNAELHPLPFLHVSYHYKELDHFHSDLKYVFTTYEDPKYKPGNDESKIIKSFSRQEILDSPEEDLKKDDKELCLYVFDEILKTWEIVDPIIFSKS